MRRRPADGKQISQLLWAAAVGLTVCCAASSDSLAQTAATEQLLESKLSKMRFPQSEDILTVSWRLSGNRYALEQGSEFTAAKVDDIIRRVENLLEIYPDHFSLEIVFTAISEVNRPAYYDAAKKTIFADIQKTTEGILAHEIAHALIDAHFEAPMPEKMQEVLAQYVDRHLWGG